MLKKVFFFNRGIKLKFLSGFFRAIPFPCTLLNNEMQKFQRKLFADFSVKISSASLQDLSLANVVNIE